MLPGWKLPAHSAREHHRRRPAQNQQHGCRQDDCGAAARISQHAKYGFGFHSTHCDIGIYRLGSAVRIIHLDSDAIAAGGGV